MKCPACGHNQPARGGQTCSQCRYRFVFAKNKDNLRDNQLMTLVQQLSDGGRLAFTRNQLAMAVAKKLDTSGCLGVVIGVVVGIAVIFLPWDGGIFIWLPAVLLGIATTMIFRRIFPPGGGDLREALQLVDRYHRAHPLEGLATGGAYAHPDPATRMEPGYAPERILVVEREDLVDALIRNGFHREQRCVVLSVDGYPQHVFAACREFIQRHRELPLYLLHDASRINEKLLARVADRPEWVFARKQWRDLGIGQEQLDRARGRKLPWLLRDGRSLRNASAHRKMLSNQARLLVDYASPATLQGALASALVAGVLMLPEPSPAGDSAGPDGGSG